MKILLLCDDYWHPGEIPADGIKPLEEKGYKFDIVGDAAGFSPDMLKKYPVVITCKCNETSQKDKTPWMTDEIQDAFVSFVENGGGLIAIHSGTVSSETTEKFTRLVGCRFEYHPNACPVMVAPIMPHPVTAGVGAFTETDEHYRIEITNADLRPIMASYSAAQGEKSKYEEDPYNNTDAWISACCLVREQGKGRVCAFTPGHFLPVWLNPEFQKTLENAIKWCSGA